MYTHNYSEFSIALWYIFKCYRILVERMEVYCSERRSVQWHIPNEYSSEMSRKSDVVIYS